MKQKQFTDVMKHSPQLALFNPGLLFQEQDHLRPGRFGWAGQFVVQWTMYSMWHLHILQWGVHVADDSDFSVKCNQS